MGNQPGLGLGWIAGSDLELGWVADKFYLLTSVFVEYDERVEVGGKAS
jgi:hypothetical protein